MNHDPLDVDEPSGYSKARQTRKGPKDPTPKLKVTPAILLGAVLQYYKSQKFGGNAIMAMEVGVENPGDKTQRRVDGLLLRYYAPPIAFEVKVSRSDWLSEVRKGTKHQLAQQLAGQMYVVAPPDVVKVEELPAGVGLVEVKPFTSKVKFIQRAARGQAGLIGWHQAAQIAAGVLRAADQGVV